MLPQIFKWRSWNIYWSPQDNELMLAKTGQHRAFTQNDVSMLVHRLRRCPNIETALGECPCLLYTSVMLSWLWSTAVPPSHVIRDLDKNVILTLILLSYFFLIFSHLCLATAIHNFKWPKITHNLFNLNANISKFYCLDTHVIPNNSDLVD